MVVNFQSASQKFWHPAVMITLSHSYHEQVLPQVSTSWFQHHPAVDWGGKLTNNQVRQHMTDRDGSYSLNSLLEMSGWDCIYRIEGTSGWSWRVYILSFRNFTAKMGALGLMLSTFPSSDFSKGAVSFNSISHIQFTYWDQWFWPKTMLKDLDQGFG